MKHLSPKAREAADRWRKLSSFPAHSLNDVVGWYKTENDQVLMKKPGVAVVSCLIGNKVELVLQAYLPAIGGNKGTSWYCVSASTVDFSKPETSQRQVEKMAEMAEKIIALRKQGWLLMASGTSYINRMCISEGNGRIVWQSSAVFGKYSRKRVVKMHKQLMNFVQEPSEIFAKASTYKAQVHSLRVAAQLNPMALQQALMETNDSNQLTEALSRAEDILQSNPNVHNLQDVMENMRKQLPKASA